MEEKVQILFDDMHAEIKPSELQGGMIDVDFSNYMVRFERQLNGKWMATNAVNGYGNNCANEVYGRYAQMVIR